MNPEQERSSESVSSDVDAHEQLPAKTKELLLLQDEAQKATGPEEVALNKKIADKSG
jgi:hypothetical protein